VTAGTPSLTLADHRSNAESFDTSTTYQALVVIFQETYLSTITSELIPLPANPAGEPKFKAQDDHACRSTALLAGGLLDQNPNSVKPFRLDRSQAVTCDQNQTIRRATCVQPWLEWTNSLKK